MAVSYVDNIPLNEVEELLYTEADYLDASDLNSWFELYTEDGVYWMPSHKDQTSPETEISLFYDDRLLMEVRRRNFGHDLAASMQHTVDCSHVIGNVRVVDSSEDASECTVTSRFQVAYCFRNEQTVYAGKYTHKLRKEGDAWRIAHKKVDLVNAHFPLKSIVIYL